MASLLRTKLLFSLTYLHSIIIKKWHAFVSIMTKYPLNTSKSEAGDIKLKTLTDQ